MKFGSHTLMVYPTKVNGEPYPGDPHQEKKVGPVSKDWEINAYVKS